MKHTTTKTGGGLSKKTTIQAISSGGINVFTVTDPIVNAPVSTAVVDAYTGVVTLVKVGDTISAYATVSITKMR